MNRKIVTRILIAILLILIIILPYNSIAKINDDVEISISAGHLGKNIGLGVSIDVINYKENEIIVNCSYTRDRVFAKDFPDSYSYDFIVPPEKYWISHISIGDGLGNGLRSFFIYQYWVNILDQ